MQVPLGDTYYVKFTTRSFSTGAPTTLSGTPAISVYEEANLTQITAGITLTADYDSVTGLNDVAIVATSGNGYEAGKYYSVVITTGTVGGVSVVGEVVGHFRIMEAETTAGRPTALTSAIAANAISATAIASSAITAAKIATDAITADKIAANAIGASELATDAVTEIQSGLATSSALATAQADLDTITGADGVTLATTQANYAPLVSSDLPTNFADLAITATTGRVTVGTNADKTGYSLTQTFPTNFADLAITATTGLVSVGTNSDKTGYSISGTLNTLDDLDTAQDTQHGLTRTDIAGLNDLSAAQVNAEVDTAISDASLATAAALATVDGIVDNLNLGIIYGAAQTGTLNTTTATTDLTGYADDELIGRVIIFTGGTANGQASDITDYASASGTVTYTAITTAPANGDSFKIV